MKKNQANVKNSIFQLKWYKTCNNSIVFHDFIYNQSKYSKNREYKGKYRKKLRLTFLISRQHRVCPLFASRSCRTQFYIELMTLWIVSCMIAFQTSANILLNISIVSAWLVLILNMATNQWEVFNQGEVWLWGWPWEDSDLVFFFSFR